MTHKVASEHEGLTVQHPDDTSNEMPNATETLRSMDPRKETVTQEPEAALTNALGMFSMLPIEVRHSIFFKAMEVDERPVYMKACCCVPSHLNWQPGKCDKEHAKYPVGTGRFNLLYVSKAIRQEAMHIMYTLCKLRITIENNLPKYLCGTRSKDHKLPPMWGCIAQFRNVDIEVPPSHIKCGHPARYTDRILNILQIFQKHRLASDVPIKDPARNIRTINFGSMFHSTLPFNIDNQDVRNPRVLIAWIAFQSKNPREPGFHQLRAETRVNLRRIIHLISESPDRAGWKILVNTDLDNLCKPDEPGGARELETLKSYCQKHGVELAHTDRYDSAM